MSSESQKKRRKRIELKKYLKTQKLYNYLHRLESQKSTKSIREAVESNHIRDALKSMLYESTKRRPLILITVSEI